MSRSFFALLHTRYPADMRRVLLETGTTGHLGGGVRILLAEPDAFLRGIGVRAQAALSLRAGGIEIDEGGQKIIVASGGLFVRF